MEWIINRGKADAGFSSEIIVSDEKRVFSSMASSMGEIAAFEARRGRA